MARPQGNKKSTGRRMSGGSSQPRLAHLARGGASSSSDMHPAKKRRQRAGPRDIADVYDYAVAQSSGGARGEGADRKGKGRARPKGERAARRATAGMHDSDEEEESAYPRRRGGKAQDDDDEEDDEDEDETEIGPTVFDDSDAEEGIQGEDEDIESDEAFGESDEERFDGWKFGERQGDKRATKAPSKKKRGADVDLDEDDGPDSRTKGKGKGKGKAPKAKAAQAEDSEDEEEDDDEEEEVEDEDDDDEDMVDLSRMLEAGSADESDEQGSSSDADDDSASADGSREDRLAELIDSLAQPAKRRAEEGDEVDAEGGAPAAKRSRRVLSERTEAVPEGEFAAPGRGSAGLRVEDLLSPLSGQAGLSGVRNSARILADARPGRGDGQQPLASKRGGGALSAPLPTIVQDRLDRAAAYEQTRAEVEGWAPTIKRVREAEHLSFPLQQTKEAAPSNAALTANFAPSNEFENTIAGLLQAGGMTEKQLAQQEDLAMKDLSPEEVAQRRAELRRMRELMFRAEQKAKRVNKIKSKTYRKIKRRERERAQDILAGPSDEQDHEDPEDRLKAEQARARERATLKHKNTGKWARGVMGRREQDVDGRMAIEEQLQRGEQLRRKIQGLGSGDESEPDDYSDLDDNAEEDEEGIRAGAFDELRALEQREAAQAEADEEAALKAGGKKGVYNMKFMKDAREREARKANGMVDDFVAELDGLGEDEEDDEKDAQKARVIRLQGNAGRAFYGTGSIQGQKDTGAAPVSAATSSSTIRSSEPAQALAEDDGDAAVPATVADTRTPRAPKRQSALSASTPTIDEPSANPWLTAGEGTSGARVSRKKNEVLVGKESSAATKAAHRAERTKAKGDEARAAAADDAALEIDPNAQLQLVSAQEGAAVRKGQDKGKGSKAKGPAGADEGEGSSDDDSPVDEPTVVRGRGPTAFAQRSLVAEAFANDDVQADFAAAKRAIIEAEAPREEDLTLPGWGNWGGKGVRKSGAARRRKFVKTIPGLAPEQRKDAKMENVIINEKKDKKAEKYKAKDLPYPYTSAAQYEMAMKAPLGPEWNTRSQHQRLTLPKVVTKPGKAIQPIERKF